MAKQKNTDPRARLIRAGLEIFAEHGFKGTTTRMLAQHAGCNLSAIPYYFGGKEGLYHAVFQEILGLMKESLDSVLEKTGSFPEDDTMNPEQALSLLKKLLGVMCEIVCGKPEAVRFVKLVVNEQMMPSSAFDLIYENHMKRLLDTISRLIMIITGSQDKRRASLKAFTLIGQILVFRTARESIVRYLDLDGYSEEETLEIRDLVTSAIEGCLGVPST
ncbi:MAG: CerR family C-terminal domain-containing protein [Desulfobacteraceae bacterium]|nr:CerR family C-terminal domain-containing protein [Desulfobacteraceae bacterium]